MIEAKNLTKTFDKMTALDNVSFKIGSGKVLGIIGPNGSGKSTLLRTIAGVFMPDSGSVFIDGEPVGDNPALKDRIFYLSDKPYFFTNSTTMEMAEFYNKMYSHFNFERFNSLSSFFPIDINTRVRSFSKGMQQQAALMLALSTDPDYLLLDEAFDGLDPVIRTLLKKLIIDGIVNRQMTVIISSHNLRELEDLCDSATLLHDGKIIFNEELDTLKSRLHKVQAVFAEKPDAGIFEGLDILKSTVNGSVYHMVIRGSQDEIERRLNAASPLFTEFLTPTLEEMFINELEAADYDINNILG